MGKDKMIAKEINFNSSGSGSDGDTSGANASKSTPHQIHEMEALFKECPNPSDKQVKELGHKLGLESSHVNLWFQNRRNQMKAQHDQQERIQLQASNERLRVENKRCREALREASVACATCGRPLGAEEMSDEECQLRLANAILRAEIGIISRVAATYNGKHFPSP